MAQQIALRIHADARGLPLVRDAPDLASRVARVARLCARAAAGRHARSDRASGRSSPRTLPRARAAGGAAGRAARRARSAASCRRGTSSTSWPRSRARAAITLHMDGARLWEAREAYAPRTLRGHLRAVRFRLRLVLQGHRRARRARCSRATPSSSREARVWRKRMGGTLVQLHPYVASAAMRFDAQLAKMPAYRRACARARRRRLARIPGRPGPAVAAAGQPVSRSFPGVRRTALDRRARSARADEGGMDRAAASAPSPVPGWSYLELYVGDNLLALDDTVVTALVREAAGDRPGGAGVTRSRGARRSGIAGRALSLSVQYASNAADLPTRAQVRRWVRAALLARRRRSPCASSRRSRAARSTPNSAAGLRDQRADVRVR